MPERDHILDLHAKQGPDAVPCKIGKQVPVIAKIGDDNAGREQPDAGFCDTNPAGQVCMPAVNIDGPDGFKAGLNNPCDEDNEG